jgi:branched-chain amino acid transport system permease protein
MVLSEAWNLFSGYTGYVNFGVVAFVGIGSYVTAILINNKLPFFIGWLCSGLVTALLAFALGSVIFRIKEAYFAIATLSLNEVVRVLCFSEYLVPLTRGGTGIWVFTDLSITHLYYVMGAVAIGIIFLTYEIANSNIGLCMIAIREEEVGAMALGINRASILKKLFILSCFFLGFTGGINATFIHFFDPDMIFSFAYNTKPIIMALFGGSGTVFGPVIGASIISLVDEILWSSFLELHIGFLGLIIVLVTLLMPEGLITTLQVKRLLKRSRKF